MMGLPGQSLEDWTDTLAKILAMDVEHISCYSLILEEGTPFYQEEAAGKLSLPSDEEERRMYHTAVRQLAAAGYRQYEISNFAKPGYACLHNLCYWDLTSYLGPVSYTHLLKKGCVQYREYRKDLECIWRE